ncbi:MAG: 2-C-methyl-D-erythritol 4-phosphate cytidylyltransferase [Lachnospiraceae bacterium]|jgi:2-C-methyl-D-erythritol 4-phosphate cytidylyltransferase
MSKSIAIILSAGRGLRACADIPKQYIEAGGRPVLSYCLESFDRSDVNDMIVVAAGKDIDFVQKDIVEKYGFSKVRAVIPGGAERYESVLNGIRAARAQCGAVADDIVLIHDGARPFVTTYGINRLIEETRVYGAVVAAALAKDTIKISDEDGFVEATTDRTRTWAVQTPQCFVYELIEKAYEKIVGTAIGIQTGFENLTDDAMVFERVWPNHKIKLLNIGEDNTKITTPRDVEFMRWMFSERK